MFRPLALTALAIGGVAAGLATAAIAFRADDTSRADAPRVVLATSVESPAPTPAPGEFPDGLAMGPDGTAPELVIVDSGETDEPARPSPRPSPERPAPVTEPAPEATPQPTHVESEPLPFETPEPDAADASSAVHIEPDDGSVRSGRRGGIAVGVDRGRRGDGGIRIGVSGVDCRPGATTLVNVRGPGLGGGFGGGYSSGF